MNINNAFNMHYLIVNNNLVSHVSDVVNKFVHNIGVGQNNSQYEYDITCYTDAGAYHSVTHKPRTSCSVPLATGWFVTRDDQR